MTGGGGLGGGTLCTDSTGVASDGVETSTASAGSSLLDCTVLSDSALLSDCASEATVLASACSVRRFFLPRRLFVSMNIGFKLCDRLCSLSSGDTERFDDDAFEPDDSAQAK